MNGIINMTTAASVLQIAKSQLGKRFGRNQPSKYGLWYGVEGFETAPWCAMFVSWVFSKAGMPLHPIQHSKGFAYCPYGLRWLADNNQVYRNPEVGDIVFFDWGRDGVPDHVGIVESVHPTYIKTIEGNTSTRNQSNGGMVMRRTRYYPSCIGFARPQYKENETDISWTGFYLQLSDPYTEGKEVKEVQTLLVDYGYDIAIDGAYGPQTEEAVYNFQIRNNLEIDGVVGPRTWKKLREIKK